MTSTLRSIITAGIMAATCLQTYQAWHRSQEIERLAACEDAFKHEADIRDCVAVLRLVDRIDERRASK